VETVSAFFRKFPDFDESEQKHDEICSVYVIFIKLVLIEKLTKMGPNKKGKTDLYPHRVMNYSQRRPTLFDEIPSVKHQFK